MTLKQLVYFVTIVECGNISKASHKLHIAQPPLSSQIKALESEYEIALFERGPRRIQLTPAGAYLYKEAKQILKNVENIELTLQDYSDRAHTNLKIGSVSPGGIHLLGKYLRHYQSNCLNLNITILEAHTDALVNMVLKESLELAIVRTPFPQENLTCHFLGNEPMYVVASTSYFPNDTSCEISLENLSVMPLIYHRRFEEFLKKVFEGNHLPFTSCCTSDDGRTSLALAQTGIGCAIITESTLPDTLPDGIIKKKIASELLFTRLAIIHKKGKKLSESANNFLNILLKDIDN